MLLSKGEYSKDLSSYYRKALIHCYITYSLFFMYSDVVGYL